MYDYKLRALSIMSWRQVDYINLKISHIHNYIDKRWTMGLGKSDRLRSPCNALQ